MQIKCVVMDGAKENCSSIIKAWVKERSIKHHTTSSYRHQSNGRVERFNQTIEKPLNKLRERGTLHSRLKRVILAYNETYHSAIGISPNKARLEKNQAPVKKAISLNQGLLKKLNGCLPNIGRI